MTLRLTLGVDPGQSGAIAALADGVPAGFIDMPTKDRKAGGEEIDAPKLAAAIRGIVMQHPGAYVYAVLEQVSAMPGQGGSSMFRFGQSDGVVRGVLGALGILTIEVHPATWKKRLGLVEKRERGHKVTPAEKREAKNLARLMAVRLYPQVAEQLARKKDIGRAEAALIARWAELTEQIARAA
jgi:crossover junction endodeoxyribonuclease RuvC